MRMARRRWAKLSLLLAGGMVLGGSPCVSAQMGRQIATNTTSTIANLLIDAFLIEPLDNAIDQRNEALYPE